MTEREMNEKLSHLPEEEVDRLRRDLCPEREPMSREDLVIFLDSITAVRAYREEVERAAKWQTSMYQ